MAWEWQNLCRL